MTSVNEDGKATKCKCRTRCNGRRCGCFLGNSVCTENCSCKGHCQNPFNSKQEHPEGHGESDIVEDTDGEHTTKENSDTFISPEAQLAKVVTSPKRSLDQNDTSTPLSEMNNAEQDDLNGPKLAR